MMYATILGSFQGCDTFLQAAGSHLYLLGMLSWSLTCLSCVLSGTVPLPLDRSEQSTGEDWSQVCCLLGLLWSLSCQIKRRCWQSASQFVRAEAVMYQLREALAGWILQVVLAEILDLGYRCERPVEQLSIVMLDVLWVYIEANPGNFQIIW